MISNSIKIFSGNSHPELAEKVAKRIGITVGKINVTKYSNQEMAISIGSYWIFKIRFLIFWKKANL